MLHADELGEGKQLARVGMMWDSVRRHGVGKLKRMVQLGMEGVK